MTKELEKANPLHRQAIYQPTIAEDRRFFPRQYRVSTWMFANLNIINDNIKYLAIIPAVIGSFFALGKDPLFRVQLSHFMFLNSPWSAVLSIFTFNCCLLTYFLGRILRNNSSAVTIQKTKKINFLYTYAFALAIASFLGIKLIDLFIVALGVN